MKAFLGQLSLKYIGPKIWSDIPKNLKCLWPYSFEKQYKNVLLSRQNSCWFSFHLLVTLYYFDAPLFLYIFYLYSCSPHAPVHKHVFLSLSCCFVCLFISDLDSMHFVTYIFLLCMWNVFNQNLICSGNRAGWKLDPRGLSPTLCDSNMSEHNHQFAKPGACFYIFLNTKLISALCCCCSCCIHVTSWFESRKCMNKPLPRSCLACFAIFDHSVVTRPTLRRARLGDACNN